MSESFVRPGFEVCAHSAHKRPISHKIKVPCAAESSMGFGADARPHACASRCIVVSPIVRTQIGFGNWRHAGDGALTATSLLCCCVRGRECAKEPARAYRSGHHQCRKRVKMRRSAGKLGMSGLQLKADADEIS